MRVKSHAVKGQAWHSHRIAEQASEDEGCTRYHKQPSRAVHQEKSKCAPSIAVRFEMRRMGSPPVWMQCNRHLGNLLPVEAGLDDHLCREFHAGAPKVQSLVKSL